MPKSAEAEQNDEGSAQASPFVVEPAGAQASPADTRATPGSTDVPGGSVLAKIGLVSAGFFLIQILTYGYGRDQGIYAMVARILLDGGMPYRDAFDFKPPGIFVIFALARVLFGSAQWGIRVVEVAGLVATAVAMTRLAERWWGDRRIGAVAAGLAVLVHAQLDFWHTSQPESFGGMLTVFGLLAATPPGTAHERRLGEPALPSPRRMVLAGALFGMAGLLKPPLAGGGAALALVLAWPSLRLLFARGAARREATRSPEDQPGRAAPSRAGALLAALRPAALIALGGALPVAACVAWFAARGALRDMLEVLFVFTPPYTALGWRGVTVLGLSWYGTAEWLLHYSGPVALGLGCLLALHPETGERRGVAVILLIIAVQLAGVVMQAKFFPYHYGASWPVASMLAALGLWKAWAWAVRRGPLSAGLLVVGFSLAALARSATKDVPDSYIERCLARLAILAKGGRDVAELDRLASVADVNAGANRAVAAFLRERVPPGAPVFVWGFEPVIYDLADRPPATRYLYNVPQRVAWAKDDARADLMRDLTAHPPLAIVVERYDVFPSVTGEAIDSRDTLDRFPALSELIADRYDAAVRIQDFDVYLALPAPAAQR
ncbi:MAG: hypothetical protein IT372_03895 [Polyangiaceae bacterium]|nr:hypothetical protein [Polyangiaceae bacterium]